MTGLAGWNIADQSGGSLIEKPTFAEVDPWARGAPVQYA